MGLLLAERSIDALLPDAGRAGSPPVCSVDRSNNMQTQSQAEAPACSRTLAVYGQSARPATRPPTRVSAGGTSGRAQAPGRERSRSPYATAPKSRALPPTLRSRPVWAPATTGPPQNRATSAASVPQRSQTLGRRPVHGAPSTPPPAALTVAPTIALPAGLFIMGLPRAPSAAQLDAVYRCVSGLSPTLGGLERGFQLASVLRGKRASPSFILSHLSFANSSTVSCILKELKDGSSLDGKGRAKIRTPVGVLKVSQAPVSAARRRLRDAAPVRG